MNVIVKKEEKAGQDKERVPLGGSEYGGLSKAAANLRKIREKEPIKNEPLSEGLRDFLGC